MLPSDLNLRIGKVKNYNNKILVSSPSFKIGTNLKINHYSEKDKLDIKPKQEPGIKSNKEQKQDIKMIRTKPKIGFKKEDKLDIEMMKTKPDTNKITFEEEKTALISGITDIYLYSIVDIQMIYLLIFVIKYVYIKTPTPVISAHKF